MKRLITTDKRLTLLFTLIAILSISLFYILKIHGVTFRVAYNANIVGLLLTMALSMVSLIVIFDKFKFLSKDDRYILIITSLLRSLSFMIVIIIFPFLC